MPSRRTALAAVLGAACLFAAPLASAQTTHTLKVGHGAQAAHPTHLALEQLAKEAASRSGGRLVLQVFPDRQLGEERDLVEGLQLGSVDMAVVSTGPLGNFVPQINVLDLPFLFASREHATKVFDGPIGRELLDKFSGVGIYGAAIWENGWRHLTTRKPIATAADLKGLKLRTMANEVHIAAFKELGAGPVPMAWGEVYTSLEQGVIDAQENPVTVIATNSLWEVQKVLTLTGHVYGPHVVMISQRTLDKLPADLRDVLKKLPAEIAAMQRATSARLEQEQLGVLKSKGMTVNSIETAPLRERVAPVITQYEKKFGKELLDRIRQSAG